MQIRLQTVIFVYIFDNVKIIKMANNKEYQENTSLQKLTPDFWTNIESVKGQFANEMIKEGYKTDMKGTISFALFKLANLNSSKVSS